MMITTWRILWIPVRGVGRRATAALVGCRAAGSELLAACEELSTASTSNPAIASSAANRATFV